MTALRSIRRTKADCRQANEELREHLGLRDYTQPRFEDDRLVLSDIPEVDTVVDAEFSENRSMTENSVPHPLQ